MKSALRRSALPRVSSWLVRLFAGYSRGYLRRRFHSVRILKSGLPPSLPNRPLLIYLNHAAWWDPLVCLQLAQTYLRDRTSFAPIEAGALERYPFFERLGFYPVKAQSRRGALDFLATTSALLASPRHAVWITPQGRFMDVRERPLRLQRGLGTLAGSSGNAAILPLAIEYAFWTEPRPEILVSFGGPIIPDEETARAADEWTDVFTLALECTQDELAARSCRRDAAEWLMLDRGASGVSAIYDLWRAAKASFGGRPFAREHCPEERS